MGGLNTIFPAMGNPRASLAVSVTAVRDLIDLSLRSARPDAQTVRALTLARDALDALWGALEDQAADEATQARDCLEFFNSAPLPCALTDVNGRLKCANQALADLVGLAPAELSHRPLGAFFASQPPLMPAYLMDLLARGREPRAMHWRAAIRGPDGIVPVEVSAREVGRSRGSVSGLSWLFWPLVEPRDGAAERALPGAEPRQTPR